MYWHASVLDGFGASLHFKKPPFCSFQQYRVHLSLLDWIMAPSCSGVSWKHGGSKLGRVFFALINFKYLWGSKKTWHVEKHCVWTFLDTSKWRLCCSENDDDQPWDFGYFLTKDVPLFGPMAFRRVAVRSIEGTKECDMRQDGSAQHNIEIEALKPVLWPTMTDAKSSYLSKQDTDRFFINLQE